MDNLNLLKVFNKDKYMFQGNMLLYQFDSDKWKIY